MTKVMIGNKVIGEREKPFIIAEAGVNHDNDFEKAKNLIKMAAEAGADAIKFQNFTADTLTTRNAKRYWSKELDTDKGKTQHDYFQNMKELTKENYLNLKKYADELGIIFFSTPFYLEAVDLLEELDVQAYKIASADLPYHQLLKKVAKTGKPIIMSVGSSFSEIQESVNVIRKEGNDKIILLHCILSYPCDDKDANLLRIKALKEKFPDCVIGYSDHTRGLIPPIVAMALGASVIEKHYTGEKNSNAVSADHRFAVDPKELRELVNAAKIVHESLGESSDKYYATEEKAHELARRAVVAEKNIKQGEIISADMLACKRAGKGLDPKHLESFVGKKAKQYIERDTIMSFDFVENGK